VARVTRKVVSRLAMGLPQWLPIVAAALEAAAPLRPEVANTSQINIFASGLLARTLPFTAQCYQG
jgi:hypothetical protein